MFVFWLIWQQENLLLKFTDLYIISSLKSCFTNFRNSARLEVATPSSKDQRDMTYRTDCSLHVVYLKFKDSYLMDTSADIHIAIQIAIHRYVYQLMCVFCDRLTTAAPDCWTGQNKDRYFEQERSFLLVSLKTSKNSQLYWQALLSCNGDRPLSAVVASLRQRMTVNFMKKSSVAVNFGFR